jgi:quercetin dioxygenase-like cupin family protein
MQIARNSLEIAAGPSDWFTRAVYIDTVAAPSELFRLSASSVHFTPGARTAWHTPPERPDDLRHGGRRPLPAARRTDR